MQGLSVRGIESWVRPPKSGVVCLQEPIWNVPDSQARRPQGSSGPQGPLLPDPVVEGHRGPCTEGSSLKPAAANRPGSMFWLIPGTW